jgi:hypothetical protein
MFLAQWGANWLKFATIALCSFFKKYVGLGLLDIMLIRHIGVFLNGLTLLEKMPHNLFWIIILQLECIFQFVQKQKILLIDIDIEIVER